MNNDEYSFILKQSYAVCSFLVPSWVNKAIARMILSDPVFLDDVRNAHKKYSSLMHHYADLVRNYTDREASKWASQYIPKTAPAFCIECESSVMDIMVSLPEGLSCVPFNTDLGGIEGTIDDNLLYDKSCRGDVGALVTLKAKDAHRNKEAATFNQDAYALSSLSRFLYPDKVHNSYKTELLDLDACPDATGRLQGVMSGRISIGLFSPVNGKNGGSTEEMRAEAESVYTRFTECLEPLKKELDNGIQSWIESASETEQGEE